ncbi:MAG: hypothetical protein LBI34_00470 [Puniceicoccales bacterium]|nr:hypothetical protein [Puniceicoccales bacterium]
MPDKVDAANRWMVTGTAAGSCATWGAGIGALVAGPFGAGAGSLLGVVTGTVMGLAATTHD